MTDHAKAALASLQRANEVHNEQQAFYLVEAQVHAALEQAKWLREIADQLDIRPKRGRGRPPAASRVPVHR